MQVNSINSHPSFGAKILTTRPLVHFVSNLLSGGGVRCYSLPEKDVVKNFDTIHKIFPLKEDVVTFTNYFTHVGGKRGSNDTVRVVQGTVESQGVKAPFSFAFRDSDFNGGTDLTDPRGVIPHMEAAFLEAKTHI